MDTGRSVIPVPGRFERKLQRNSFFGLNAKDQQVGYGLGISIRFAAEDGQRRGAKLDGDLGNAARQILAGSHVKRHARPSPVIHEECHGRVSIGLRFRIHALLLAKPGHLFAGHPPRPVLSGDARWRQRLPVSSRARSECSLARSSRTASEENVALGSMATVDRTCNKWFWIMSRSAPAS